MAEPSGRLIVVIEGGEFTTRFRVLGAVAPLASVTVKSMLWLPDEDGVPVKDPDPDMLTPNGRLTGFEVQAKGPVPVNGWTAIEKTGNGTPWVPGGMKLFCTTGFGLMGKFSDVDMVAPTVSVAVTVKTKLPVADGVPLNVPLLFRVTPVGSPLPAVQVAVPVPPELESAPG